MFFPDAPNMEVSLEHRARTGEAHMAMLRRAPLVMTLAGYALKVVVVGFVLLHDFENLDSAILASLLLLIYGAISNQISGDSAFSTTWFLSLAKLIGQSSSGE